MSESERSESADHIRGAGEMVTLERAIVGALTDTINAHGPITRQWIGSAAKRVAGNLPALRAAPPSEREAKLEEALREIAEWQMPRTGRRWCGPKITEPHAKITPPCTCQGETPYHVEQGSNGERDHIRAIARAALGEAPDGD